jgi:hypothetical protein
MKRRQLIYSGVLFALSSVGLNGGLERLKGPVAKGEHSFNVQTTVRIVGNRKEHLPGKLDQILLSGVGQIHGRYQELLDRKVLVGELLAKSVIKKSSSEIVLRHQWSSETAYRLYRESQETKAVLAVLAQHGIQIDESNFA